MVLVLALLALGCEPSPTWSPLRVPPSPTAFGASNWPYSDDESDTLGRGILGSDTSAVLATLFGLLGFGGALSTALFWMWWHRRRARIELSHDPNAPLRDGPAVVFGTVEAPPNWAGAVVRIDIRQAGTESQQKGTWYHTWREYRRDVNIRPFTIVRDDGLRVQVEPDARVAVHDSHDEIVQEGYDRRTRISDIAPDERVHIYGNLSGAAQAQRSAYRQGLMAPTLRPPLVGRMVISAEPPGATSLARMRLHRNWAIGILVTAVLMFGAVMPEYVVLVGTGQVEWVTPTDTAHWRTWHKPKNSQGYWVYHYAIRGVFSRNGATVTVSDEVGEGPSRCVEQGGCARVPFVVSRVNPSWHQFGTAPHLGFGRVMTLVCFVIFIFCITYPLTVVSSRPWYLRKKVVDNGTGKLSESFP